MVATATERVRLVQPRLSDFPMVRLPGDRGGSHAMTPTLNTDPSA